MIAASMIATIQQKDASTGSQMSDEVHEDMIPDEDFTSEASQFLDGRLPSHGC